MWCYHNFSRGNFFNIWFSPRFMLHLMSVHKQLYDACRLIRHWKTHLIATASVQNGVVGETRELSFDVFTELKTSSVLFYSKILANSWGKLFLCELFWIDCMHTLLLSSVCYQHDMKQLLANTHMIVQIAFMQANIIEINMHMIALKHQQQHSFEHLYSQDEHALVLAQALASSRKQMYDRAQADTSKRKHYCQHCEHLILFLFFWDALYDRF